MGIAAIGVRTIASQFWPRIQDGLGQLADRPGGILGAQDWRWHGIGAGMALVQVCSGTGMLWHRYALEIAPSFAAQVSPAPKILGIDTPLGAKTAPLQDWWDCRGQVA